MRARRLRPGAAVGACLGLLLLSLPARAPAAERVIDGGFDQLTICTTNPQPDCTNPVWTETNSGGFNELPVCEAGIGNCASIGSPLSQPAWAQFGGRTEGGFVTQSWSVQQAVQIPAAPARLSFQLRIVSTSNEAQGSLVARIDGAPVFGASDTTPGFASYAPVTLDVSGFAGGVHALSFEATDAMPVLGPVTSDSWSVDNISLDAPDVASAPAVATKRKCRKGFRPKKVKSKSGKKKTKCVRKKRKRRRRA